jgi:oxygen-independent coproporphyrinogen-3 oxidase
VSQAIDHLRAADICNISVDLMYGFPGETLGDWECDIEHALSLDVEHISAYCLMVEEGTELHRMDVAPCDEETERQMYYTLIDRLDAAGYEHYEISNFAKQTSGGAMPSVYRSRHNSGYWNDIPFVGLGAAAHSYDKQSRSWNCANLRDYIAAIGRGHLPSEREVIDADTHYNDLVTTALRTSDGLDFDMLSEDYRLYCMKEAERFLSSGLLVLDGHRLKLTRSGLFVSDMVMASLLCVPVESGSEK